MEAELESKEPMEMGDDASASEDERDRGTTVTLVERHEPVAVPGGGGRGTKTRVDVLESRKHVASGDATVE